MRILVVGAGATGGYFGGRLAAAGRDVTFLVRPARAEHLRAHRLHVVSPAGDLHLAPQLVTAGEIAAPYDTILLTVKAFSLEAALADLAPAVGPKTTIVPVLNGMKHMDAIAGRFGASVLVGGVARVVTTLDDQGRVLHLTPMHDLAYGEMNGAASVRIMALDAAMRGAGFDAKLSPTIEREMWEKWVLLATVGGANCLMRGSIGEIAAAEGGAALSLALLAEAVAIATAEGHPPSEAFVATTGANLTTDGSLKTTSMYRDLVSGAPVEAEQIVGDLVARARRRHVPAPYMAAALANLSVYQNRLPS